MSETGIEDRTKVGELDEAADGAPARETPVDVPGEDPSIQKLRAIADALPALVAYVDAERRYRYVNRTYEEWFGQPAESIIGRHVRDVIGDAAYRSVLPHLEAALRGQSIAFESEVPYQHGGFRTVEAAYRPDIDAEGRVRGYVALVTDVTERKRFELRNLATAARTERLLAVTAAMADAITREQVYDALIEHITGALSSASTALWLLDESGEKAVLAGSVGYSELAKGAVAIIPVDVAGAFPVADVLCTSKPLFFDSQQTLVAAYPRVAEHVTKGLEYSIACLPIEARGRSIGALSLTFSDSRRLDRDERAFLSLVARACGQALERVRLVEVERESRRAAEEAVERLSVLNRAAKTFAEAGLDLGPLLQTVAEQVTIDYADYCVITLLSDDRRILLPAGVHHRDPMKDRELKAHLASTVLHVDEGFTGRAVTTGKPVLIQDPMANGVREALSSAHQEWLDRNPFESIVVAPLRARDDIIGTIGAGRSAGGPPFTEADVRLFEDLAERAGSTIENSRLYEAHREARRVAEEARRDTERLHALAARVIAATSRDEIFDAAHETIEDALGTSRSAVLLYDRDAVMRFASSRGLPESYREAVEGHTPWRSDDPDPKPIFVPDVRAFEDLAPYRALFERERIGAIGFFPLVAAGRLVGKFMVYYPEPRALDSHALEMARGIAHHVVAGVERFAAIERERAYSVELERSATQIGQLQSATARLASAMTALEVSEILLDVAQEVLEATAGVVYVAKGDTYQLTLSRGIPAAAAKYPTLSADAPLPLATALRESRPIWLESYDELLALFPNLRDARTPSSSLQAVVAIPLVHAGRVGGGFALSFSTARRFEPSIRQWIDSLASQCALALERARLYEAERAARREAETLLRIAEAITSAQLDLDALVQRVIDEATFLVGADFGAFFYDVVNEAGEPTELHRTSGTPPEALARIGRPNERTFDPAAIGFPSFLSVPVINGSGTAVGEISLGHREPSWFSEQHERLVKALAANAGIAIDNARLFLESRRAEESLARREVERERLVGELERTVRFNEMFAGILGHDLRNPLAAMVTAAELVLRRTKDERTQLPLQRILSSGERMARMIDQLLDFTRARVGGGLPIDARDASLEDLVTQAVEEVQLTHPERPVEIDLQGDVRGTWDVDRLAQVFSNLVSNAVEHGTTGVPLMLHVDGRDTDSVWIEIRNGGVIPPALLDVLFDPFRGTQHRQGRRRGLGLGLFITQQIVNAHDGEISVRSNHPEGTVFSIRLPRHLSKGT